MFTKMKRWSDAVQYQQIMLAHLLSLGLMFMGIVWVIEVQSSFAIAFALIQVKFGYCIALATILAAFFKILIEEVFVPLFRIYGKPEIVVYVHIGSSTRF
jgi:hypothetical protein